MSLEAKKRGQTLKLEIPKELPNFLADKERLEQVLFNLINNAIKYNRLNASVTLKIYLNDLRVIIEVSDEGAGISQAEQLKLFQPYQRFNTKKDNYSRAWSRVGFIETTC
jgi:signal transduction histidine kinase